jgi:hypothetical protein
VTAEIVALAFPVFVIVIVCWPFPFTATFPKATLPGFAVIVELVVTPLPAIVNTCGDPGALSVNVTLPVAAPPPVGANCALKFRLCPAPNVFGSVIPLSPKAFPATVARLIVKFEFPLFVNFTLCALLCPTTTFPKLKAEGAIVSPVCVPVPLNEIITGEFDASLAIVRLPVTAPSAVGAY